MNYPNNLKLLCKQTGYTLQEIADELHYSISAVSRYARGERPIPHEIRLRLADLLGCSIRDLIPVEAISHLSISVKTLEEIVEASESDILMRWDVYHTMGAVRASIGLGSRLQHFAELAQATDHSSVNTRFKVLLALGYQLQSCIYRDLMDYRESHLFHQKAFNIAQEIEDYELIAASLARSGVTLTQQEKAYEAIAYLTGALNILGDYELPALQGHVLQGLSEAYAKVNDAHQSLRCIDQAEGYLGASIAPERSLIRGVTIASISAQRGVNAVLLQEYRQAVTLIDESLKVYNPSLIRGRARLIAQKAEALLGMGELEASTSTALESLTLAKMAGSSKTVARVQSLHGKMLQSKERKERAVKQLGTALME